jgi:hypothetical protein
MLTFEIYQNSVYVLRDNLVIDYAAHRYLDSDWEYCIELFRDSSLIDREDGNYDVLPTGNGVGTES